MHAGHDRFPHPASPGGRGESVSLRESFPLRQRRPGFSVACYQADPKTCISDNAYPEVVPRTVPYIRT